jgi:hypothetical protein
LCTKIERPFEDIDDERLFRSNFYLGQKRRRIAKARDVAGAKKEEREGMSEEAKDMDNGGVGGEKVGGGGYMSESLGNILVSEIQLPVPKIHAGIGARDGQETMLKLLKGEGT